MSKRFVLLVMLVMFVFCLKSADTYKEVTRV